MYYYEIGNWFFFFVCNSILAFFLALGVVFFMNKFALKVMTLCYLMVFTSFGVPLSLGLLFIPHVVASPDFASFPSIDFKDFSDFILEILVQRYHFWQWLHFYCQWPITQNWSLYILNKLRKEDQQLGWTVWLVHLKSNLGLMPHKPYSQPLNYPDLKLQLPGTQILYLWQQNLVNFHKYWTSIHTIKRGNLLEHWDPYLIILFNQFF